MEKRAPDRLLYTIMVGEKVLHPAEIEKIFWSGRIFRTRAATPLNLEGHFAPKFCTRSLPIKGL